MASMPNTEAKLELGACKETAEQMLAVLDLLWSCAGSWVGPVEVAPCTVSEEDVLGPMRLRNEDSLTPAWVVLYSVSLGDLSDHTRSNMVLWTELVDHGIFQTHDLPGQSYLP